MSAQHRARRSRAQSLRNRVRNQTLSARRIPSPVKTGHLQWVSPWEVVFRDGSRWNYQKKKADKRPIWRALDPEGYEVPFGVTLEDLLGGGPNGGDGYAPLNRPSGLHPGKSRK